MVNPMAFSLRRRPADFHPRIPSILPMCFLRNRLRIPGVKRTSSRLD